MPRHAGSPLLPRAVQIIVLTGQRVEEIARLHTDQWDASERIIDWSKTKNLQPHAVPVPSLAAELIESITPNKYGWFFPSAKDPSKPVSHGTLYSFMWRQRDRAVIPVVTNRDLRRTWKTLAGKAGRAEGDPRPHPESRPPGRQLKELQPLELHARKARRHGALG